MPLTPEQQAQADALRAMLNAYDVAPSDVQAKMRDAASGKTPDYVVPTELFAAAEVRALDPEKRPAEARRDVATLNEASKQIPGIRGLVGMLARRAGVRERKK